MADEKNRSDFEDPKVDADPLNDLVRLLNEEDPFSNFSANRTRDFYNDGGEAMRRHEPQQVEMARPPVTVAEYGDYDAEGSFEDDKGAEPQENASWEKETAPYPNEPELESSFQQYDDENISDLERLEADLANSLRSSLEAYAPDSIDPIAEHTASEPNFESAEDDGWFEANEPLVSSTVEQDEELYANETEASASDEDLMSARLGYIQADTYSDPLYGASETHQQASYAEPYSEEPVENASYGYEPEEGGFEEEPHYAVETSHAAQEQEEYQDFAATEEPVEEQAYTASEAVYDEVPVSYAEEEPLELALEEEDFEHELSVTASTENNYDPLALDDIFSKSLSDDIQSNLRGSTDDFSENQQNVSDAEAYAENSEQADFSDLDQSVELSLADEAEIESADEEQPVPEIGIFTEDSLVAGMAAAVSAGMNPSKDAFSDEAPLSQSPDLATDFDDDYVSANEASYSEEEQAETLYQEEDYAPKQKQGSKLKFAALAAAVVAAAGAGYFMFSGKSNLGENQPPVIIKADEGQIKTNVAENTTPDAAPSTDQKLIYDRVSGTQTKPQERIQPRQEEVLPVETAPAAPPATIDNGSNSVGTPRRVQSVTIKPDGTITRAPVPQPEVPNLTVSQPEAPASSNGVRVITANPTQPSTAPVQVPGRETVAPSQPATTTTPVAPQQPAQVTESAPIELRPTPLEPAQSEQPTTTAQGTETPSDTEIPAIAIGSAPVPQKRPGLGAVVAQRPAVNLQTPVSIGGAPQVDGRAALEQAQAAQAQTQAELRPTTQVASNSNSGGFVVQLSAQRSQEEALRSFQALQNRFPQLLTGQEANIQRADLGARGVYYRLGVGPIASRDQASQLCNQLKTSGLPDCFVRAN